MKGDQVKQTNNQPNPMWQQMANSNVSYPNTSVQQNLQGQMSPYTMLNTPYQMQGNSGLPGNGLSPTPQSVQSILSNLFGGANISQASPTNMLASLTPMPQQSAMTPSQNLIAQYFGQMGGGAPQISAPPGMSGGMTNSSGMQPSPNLMNMILGGGSNNPSMSIGTGQLPMQYGQPMQQTSSGQQPSSAASSSWVTQ